MLADEPSSSELDFYDYKHFLEIVSCCFHELSKDLAHYDFFLLI